MAFDLEKINKAREQYNQVKVSYEEVLKRCRSKLRNALDEMLNSDEFEQAIQDCFLKSMSKRQPSLEGQIILELGDSIGGLESKLALHVFFPDLCNDFPDFRFHREIEEEGRQEVEKAFDQLAECKFFKDTFEGKLKELNTPHMLHHEECNLASGLWEIRFTIKP